LKAKPFNFKKFAIHQDRCALKVGTDGVLLGAWTNCKDARKILDIGSGTGVISLMLAQRSTAEILAIEIDKDAAEQSAENFHNSIWNERLKVIHSSIQEFTELKELEKFDLIVSNPPFYSIQKEINKRSTARSEQELKLAELLSSVTELLTTNGRFCIIFPSNRAKELFTTAAQVELFPSEICSVKGNPNSEVKRLLVEFQFTKKQPTEHQIVIEKERHNYTEEYKDLLKEYLTIF
jgi:tRNA1Val (adenine37-N6)-methyltransferase